MLAARLQLPAGIWLAIAGTSLLLALIAIFWRARFRNPSESSTSRTQYLIQFFLFAIFAFAIGAARYEHSLPDLSSPDHIAYYNDRDFEVRVTGIMSQPPQVREHQTNVKVRVESIQCVGEPQVIPVNGYLQARLRGSEVWKYGDRLQIRGHLETPPEFEDFSYREYLAQQGVYSYMGDAVEHRISSGAGNPILSWIFTYKAHALQTVYRLWPDPEASLLMEATQLHRCEQVLHS